MEKICPSVWKEGREFANEMLRMSMSGTRSVITRHVPVDRRTTPLKFLKDMNGRELIIDDEETLEDILNSMPRGEGEEAEVCFFDPGLVNANNGGLEERYESFGLKSDPRALISANQHDPVFADDFPNAAFWRNGNGIWCFVTFDVWDDGRIVEIGIDTTGRKWANGLLLGGVPV